MATTVSAIRDGIAANLESVAGMRVSALMLDAPRPPVAMVYPSSIDFDLNANRGADTYTFVIFVIVARADDRSAQRKLDGFVTGENSVKTAVETDRSLGGAANTCRVTNMTNYQQVSIGDAVYLGVEFEVEVVG